MKRVIRFLRNRETLEKANAVASLIQIVAAGIAEFERLQNLALLLSGLSTVLQLSVDISRRRAEQDSARSTRPAETMRSENVTNAPAKEN